MTKVRISLKERGRQILGLGRRGRDGETRTSAEHLGRDAGLPQEAVEADREREVDEMLSVEAEAATGEDASSARSVRLPSAPESLPATEWITPVSPTAPRPAPLPPPVAAGTHAASSAPSGPVAAPSGQPPTPSPARSPVEEPAVSSSAVEPPHAPVTAEDADLLPMPQSGGAAATERVVSPPRSVQLTDEQESEMSRRQDVQEKLVDLDRTIQSLYDRILRDNVSVNKNITNWCHNLLAEAHVIVMYRELGKLARAEWCVEQVRARLDRAEESGKQVRGPILIMVWGVIWFGIFVYLIFNPMWVLLRFNLAGFNDSFINPDIFLRALFFGGVGSVAAVFYHLFKYVSDRSFDSKYVLSYFGKPFMGMILGSMIYLTMFVAMRVLGLSPIGLQDSDAETVTNVLYTGILFFVAMAVGFKENLAFNLLNRVIKGVLGDDDGMRVPVATSGTTE